MCVLQYRWTLTTLCQVQKISHSRVPPRRQKAGCCCCGGLGKSGERCSDRKRAWGFSLGRWKRPTVDMMVGQLWLCWTMQDWGGPRGSQRLKWSKGDKENTYLYHIYSFFFFFLRNYLALTMQWLHDILLYGHLNVLTSSPWMDMQVASSFPEFRCRCPDAYAWALGQSFSICLKGLQKIPMLRFCWDQVLNWDLWRWEPGFYGFRWSGTTPLADS